ncbi:MAG: glucose-6-phosphate dehydrogenase [Acidobacteria bacterium]|nr:MAG: glucose-6-phosphate dehydrogenase [Acidobacteriota bacterium]
MEENPLRHGRRMNRSPEPCAMVIFGGSGDLTRRKLVPALYNLSRKRMIPGGFTILGISRSPMKDEEYRSRLREWVDKAEEAAPSDPETWEPFSQGIYYLPANFHDAAMYARLKEVLAAYDTRRGTGGNRIFYLATAPSDYVDIIRNLGSAGMAREDSGWVRAIIEKPFGRDLASARALNREVSAVFREDQVYRIDHYLGKETVQNLLVFRFANGIFEPIWNRQYVDHVQITAAENIGVGTRGAYYEEAGALRDMIQNHMMQLLTLVAMEPPPDFAPNSVRDEKAKVLRSIRPCTPEEVGRVAVRGQYGRGFVGGREMPAYREERGVSPNSTTETFAAIRFTIDNWRWAGVPFYVRTGKNLAKRATEIAILFRRTPHLIFRQAPTDQVESNVLALRIQPDEGITLKFEAKLPGQSMNIRPVSMDFRYGSTFGPHLSSAYERLLLDCMVGDPTLFDRIDSVELAWSLVQPFLDRWSSTDGGPIPTYASGSWGPAEADALLARENRRWRRL